MGNDRCYEDRILPTEVPVCFVIKDLGWLNTVGPAYFRVEYDKPYLASPQEAYELYLSHFTLFGEERNVFEKLCSKSAICSRIYLGLELERKQSEYFDDTTRWVNDTLITNGKLISIQAVCEQNNAELLVVLIPSPMDAHDQVDLGTYYNAYFEGVEVAAPSIQSFSRSDYDGLETSNHFINSGHNKFAKWLKPVIDSKLQKTRPPSSNY